jgi:hypothetical protein
VISTKCSFSNASNKYTKSLKEKDKLMNKINQTNKKIEDSRHLYICEGLLYFSKDKRKDLLNQAEALFYSKEIIKKLRSINDENWNTDTVDENLIRDFETVESFVNGHTHLWEKSIIFKLGGTVQGEEEKEGYSNEQF